MLLFLTSLPMLKTKQNKTKNPHHFPGAGGWQQTVVGGRVEGGGKDHQGSQIPGRAGQGRGSIEERGEGSGCSCPLPPAHSSGDLSTTEGTGVCGSGVPGHHHHCCPRTDLTCSFVAELNNMVRASAVHFLASRHTRVVPSLGAVLCAPTVDP